MPHSARHVLADDGIEHEVAIGAAILDRCDHPLPRQPDTELLRDFLADLDLKSADRPGLAGERQRVGMGAERQRPALDDGFQRAGICRRVCRPAADKARHASHEADRRRLSHRVPECRPGSPMIWPSLNTAAKGGHGAGLALLDALDDEFVAALGLRQFWTPALRRDRHSDGRSRRWCANICSPSMSFGEASAGAGGLAGAAAVDCARAAVDSHGPMMTAAATITNDIRIPASVQAGKGGRERSLPPPPSSLSARRQSGRRCSSTCS